MKKTTKTKKKTAAKKTVKPKAQLQTRPEFDIEEAVEIMRSVSRMMKD